MKVFVGICMALLLASNARACDCVMSELSHAGGGALMAGAGTWVANRYWPEHRALIGFTASTVLGFAGEGLQRAGGGKFSLLDAASNAGGAAIGALVTDRFILQPVVRRSDSGSYVGVAAHLNF